MDTHSYVYPCSCMIMWLVIETNDSVYDMSQSLDRATITTVHDISHPTHKKAIVLNQVTNYDIYINYSML